MSKYNYGLRNTGLTGQGSQVETSSEAVLKFLRSHTSPPFPPSLLLSPSKLVAAWKRGCLIFDAPTRKSLEVDISVMGEGKDEEGSGKAKRENWWKFEGRKTNLVVVYTCVGETGAKNGNGDAPWLKHRGHLNCGSLRINLYAKAEERHGRLFWDESGG